MEDQSVQNKGVEANHAKKESDELVKAQAEVLRFKTLFFSKKESDEIVNTASGSIANSKEFKKCYYSILLVRDFDISNATLQQHL